MPASRSASESATVRVPGTTSNLGPGFDTLGIALRLYNGATVTRRGGRSGRGQREVVLESPVDESSRAAATALLAEAADRFFQQARLRPFGISIVLAGDVPIARGLGSSVTARLGCLGALNRLCGGPLDRDQLFQAVSDLEGHPDNAAPAVYGGFTASAMVSGRARAVRFPVSPKARFVTLIPRFEVSTPMARKLVPQTFSKADTVHSLTRVALITAAFASGNLEALRGCFDDRIHQPYREALIPQLSRVIGAGERAGALGGWLSGSGSTLICLTLRHPAAVARAMQQELPDSDVHILSADSRGVTAG
ncbi:MAG: homoserine kinase [Verrucomicrobiae bacterium]|nr:homoserine kinase [Verrucomicrobiae bacterium]